ncbi:putative thiamine pyrophosphokinase [Nemania sp. FL0916]|nr:putative thiamine pyrophosphokinase [Nemania sp. FL0916]
MSLLEVIDACDNFPQYDPFAPGAWEKVMSQLWRFLLPGDHRSFGFITPNTVSRMPWTTDFRIDHTSRTVRLAPVPENSTPTTSSIAKASVAAIAKQLQVARDMNAFPKLHNWPGEQFPVLGAPFPLGIDRTFSLYFGIVITGSQLTVFSRSDDDDRAVDGIWIAKRGANKTLYPGMLDNAVGGAVMHGESPRESLLREALEEIGIDVKDAKPGGTVSWCSVRERNGVDLGVVMPGVQYVYDFEVDGKRELRAAESGIDWLRRLTVDEVLAALHRREFKPSCACVMIDFFIRHGVITAENDEDFADIVARLHRRLPLPTTAPWKSTGV